MSRSLVAVAALLVSTVLTAAAAEAKDEYWAQICGRSGCKIVKDRFVGAALTTEANRRAMPRTSIGRSKFWVEVLPAASAEAD